MKLIILCGLLVLSLAIQLKDNSDNNSDDMFNITLNSSIVNRSISTDYDLNSNDTIEDNDIEDFQAEIKEAEKDAEKYLYFIKVAVVDYIHILVDSLGYPVYKFSNDTEGVPTCLNQCAKKWSPLLLMNKDVPDKIPSQLNHSDFSTYKRDDDFYQLKYKNKPLYYYEGDMKPGDKPKGNNKSEYNGTFTTVSP